MSLSRKEMKRDEVRELMEIAYEWITDHGRKILAGVAILVAIVVLAGIVLFFLGRRNDRAQEALAEAVKIHAAEINAEGPDPENELSPSFQNEAARRARAKELFTEVRSKYGSTAAGKIASVYLGEIAAAQGDRETAREMWQSYIDKAGDSALQVTVRLNLISLDRDVGNASEVAERLRAGVDDGTGDLPPDVALYELGVTLEQQGEDTKARDAFQQLVDEYPNSPYVSEARQRLDSA